jgi:hypothetical protein
MYRGPLRPCSQMAIIGAVSSNPVGRIRVEKRSVHIVPCAAFCIEREHRAYESDAKEAAKAQMRSAEQPQERIGQTEEAT